MANFQVTIKVDAPSSLRNERGQFIGQAQRELYARNRELGAILRADVGRRMENRIAFGGRAAASTGRLLAVTMSDRNQKTDRWNVSVGVVDYLNSSTAKYWRTFEEGSAAVWRHPFVGTQLMKIYSMKGPSPHGTNLVTLSGAANFKHGAGRDLFVVKHEIQPADIYRQVQEANQIDQYGLQSARFFLDRVFNTPVKNFQPRTR